MKFPAFWLTERNSRELGRDSRMEGVHRTGADLGAAAAGIGDGERVTSVCERPACEVPVRPYALIRGNLSLRYVSGHGLLVNHARADRLSC
jgi:hypothetical protein